MSHDILFFFFKDFIYLFMIERERRRHRQREKQAPFRKPDARLDPRTPGPWLKPRQMLNHWATQALLPSKFFFFFLRFYLFIHREREREAETQAEGEAGSTQRARCGTQSQVSGMMPWAESRRSTAELPRRPSLDNYWWTKAFRGLLP